MKMSGFLIKTIIIRNNKKSLNIKINLNYNIENYDCNPQKYNKYIIKTINIYKFRKFEPKIERNNKILVGKFMQMVDFEFRNELIKEDFSLNYCYQCGTCSSSCPVAYITNGEYNPRKIIEQSLLGLKDLLIKDQKPNVWLCCTCQMCVEECPQNVFLTEIFERIKNRIVLLGEPYPEPYKVQAKAVAENGLAIPLSQPIIRRRNQLGLPKVDSVDIKELRKLLLTTNFENKVKFLEEDK